MLNINQDIGDVKDAKHILKEINGDVDILIHVGLKFYLVMSQTIKYYVDGILKSLCKSRKRWKEKIMKLVRN